MSPNWQVDFFRGVALDFWRLVTTPEQTRAEADFLQQALRAGEPSHVLDVPCGNGRHSIDLAGRGCRVTGVDLSAECIAEARAASGPLPATWIVAGMCRLPWRTEFDGAFCLGNSFGSPGRMDSAAVPVSTTNRASGLKRRWYKAGDIYMLSENQYHPREGRLDIQYTFIRGGQAQTKPASSYVLTANEICRMHAAAGPEPPELLGSLDGEAYQPGSPRLILISAKR